MQQSGSGGLLAIGTLNVGGPTSVSLGQANQIATLGSVSTGTLTLSDTQSLAITGPVTAGTASLTSSGSITGSGQVALGTLNGSSGGSATFSAANILSQLGSFTAGGALTVNATTPFQITGAVTAPSVQLTAAGNTIAESGNGVITTGTLSGVASTATFGSASNAIGTLGSFTAPGTLTIADGQALAVAGPVSAGTLNISTPGGISFSGTTTATTVSLAAGGQITQPSGTFTATTLNGNANGLAQFGGNTGTQRGTTQAPTASVTTLGNFTVRNGGTLALVSNTPLTIAGQLSSTYIAVASRSSMTLADGSAIVTTGLPPASQGGANPSAPGSYLQVLPDPQTGTGVFQQLGTSSIVALNGTPATLRIQIPDGGTILLNNLYGPGSNVVLGTGVGGEASGTVTLGNLFVAGQSGGARLFGSVAGENGFVAAQRSFINPNFNPRYTLNDCPIQSVSCTSVASFLSPKSFLRTQPFLTLNLLTLAAAPDPDDPELLLPNISDRDY